MRKTMDIKELAEFLGLTEDHVRGMARAGRIPIEAIIRPLGCRKYRFNRELIEEWAKATPRRRPGQRRAISAA